MKAVIQRCHRAHVEVEGEVVGRIERGLVAFVGVARGDDEATAARLARKIADLRVFSNAEGRFDLSLGEVGGGVLAISNFTLLGEARKGARPNFAAAAPSEEAQTLFSTFVTLLRERAAVQCGVFGASMRVVVENDGPVTMTLEF